MGISGNGRMQQWVCGATLSAYGHIEQGVCGAMDMRGNGCVGQISTWENDHIRTWAYRAITALIFIVKPSFNELFFLFQSLQMSYFAMILVENNVTRYF